MSEERVVVTGGDAGAGGFGDVETTTLQKEHDALSKALGIALGVALRIALQLGIEVVVDVGVVVESLEDE
ncbi:hypothetical protein ABZ682_13670 [Streptomyces griseoviridis]|uniref:hypothetical protein n=1 Tax=Streptomyces griseoviridis TaxID=45398 RepID=UPI0033C95209